MLVEDWALLVNILQVLQSNDDKVQMYTDRVYASVVYTWK